MVPGNISVIKIPSFRGRRRERDRESVLQPPPPLTLASKRFLFVLQTKGFSRGSGKRRGEDDGGRGMRGGDARWKTGAELLHLLSEGSNRPVCGIARSRFSHDCGHRMPPARVGSPRPLLVLTNFHRGGNLLQFELSRAARGYSVKLDTVYFTFL